MVHCIPTLTGLHPRDHYRHLLPLPAKQTPPMTASNSMPRGNPSSNTAASASFLRAICQVLSSVPQSPITKKPPLFSCPTPTYPPGSDQRFSIPRAIPTSRDGAQIVLSAKIHHQGCHHPIHPVLHCPTPTRIPVWARISTPTHQLLARLAAPCQATET